MNSAIRRYKRAEAELKAAEEALNAAVNPHIAKAQDDEHRIMRIIQIMPRTYTGTRRMYERILRLRERSSQND